MDSEILKQDDYISIIMDGLVNHSDDLNTFFVAEAKVRYSFKKERLEFLQHLNSATNYLYNLFIKKARDSEPIKKYKPKSYKDVFNGIEMVPMEITNYNPLSPEYEYVEPTIYDVLIDLEKEFKHLGFEYAGYLSVSNIEYAETQIDSAKETIEEDTPPNKLPNKKLLLSYKWLGKKEELNQLHEKMIDGLISSDTPIVDFKNIFSEKEISKLRPVKWHDGNASELLYFILELSEKGLIHKKNQTDYKQLAGCFIKNDCSVFKENFRQLKQDLDLKLSSEKKDRIDTLLREFV